MLLFTTGQLGYYFIYSYQQYRIKENVKAQLLANIPESSLQVIETDLNNPQISWQENEKEFSLDGELYDVVKIKKTGGKAFIYCLNDQKEKELIHGFSKAIRSQTDNNSGGKSGKYSLKFQISDFTVKQLDNIPVFNSYRKVHYCSFDATVLSSSKEVNAPPPRC